MKRRKPNFKEKVIIVKDFLPAILISFLTWKFNKAELLWMMMVLALQGKCEVYQKEVEE